MEQPPAFPWARLQASGFSQAQGLRLPSGFYGMALELGRVQGFTDSLLLCLCGDGRSNLLELVFMVDLGGFLASGLAYNAF